MRRVELSLSLSLSLVAACASAACRSNGVSDPVGDAGCVIPSMIDLYPGAGIPAPFEPGPAAPSAGA